jgi:hypothetical protein
MSFGPQACILSGIFRRLGAEVLIPWSPPSAGTPQRGMDHEQDKDETEHPKESPLSLFRLSNHIPEPQKSDNGREEREICIQKTVAGLSS